MISQSKSSIIQKFNEDANQYDAQRSKLIPCFDDFYSIPISILNTQTTRPTALDIGSGTGLFSSFLLRKYPEAKLTLIDISEKMIDIARERFTHVSNIQYIVDDYTSHEFTSKFDIIISSLSIHHLTDAEKRNLYHLAFLLLNEGGIFINADQVLGQTPFLDDLYKTDWKNKVENSGLSEKEIHAAYERTSLDKMSTLADQLNWLKESGFKDVDCVYKYFNFVVLFGRK
ncbi:class I SAM-dependent methyltransferase [Bacillus sp. BRMEA1]|uniref:class I SAM-dependent methyltransferase n=1 Tax=Neobacillus endophyticus TaxID=2738405 RepID=UPI0015671A5E|nr:class I SAM-dependent methyltransferase [Neobacillus endophyticus]NRD77125.1 class I SAM-dependent methyltransferase [Neobacillus endophyticus]